MIVSVHVPKTAGTTFGKLLEIEFSKNLILDYGDRIGWTGPEADKYRSSRPTSQSIVASHNNPNLKAIHGHFYASKYADAFPGSTLVAFVRDPVDRVVSNYQFLSEHPEIKHPLVAEFHAANPSLDQWIEWPWARNLQCAVFDVPLDRFEFIGLTEQFERSIAVFDEAFGTSLSSIESIRLNASSPINIDTRTRARISELNADDIDLYIAATKRFLDASKAL